MKKYLLGILAVALAVGFSAFTAPRKEKVQFQTNYYMFDVLSGNGGNTTFTNSQVSYIEFASSTAQGSCSGSGNKCKIGFNAADVEETFPNSGVYQLTSGSHTPATTAWQRTSL